MNTMEAIVKRKSTRCFRQEQIPDEILNTILAAGCIAPVAMAMYDSLHLTIIQNKAVLKNISDGIARVVQLDNDPLYDAPTLVLISSKEMPVPGLDYLSTGCVVENMAIAATALGVDSVIIAGAAVVSATDPSLRDILNISKELNPLISVALGYAAIPDTTTKELKVTVSTNRV